MNIDQLLIKGQIASALIAIALGIALLMIWIMIRDARDRNRQPR